MAVSLSGGLPLGLLQGFAVVVPIPGRSIPGLLPSAVWVHPSPGAGSCVTYRHCHRRYCCCCCCCCDSVGGCLGGVSAVLGPKGMLHIAEGRALLLHAHAHAQMGSMLKLDHRATAVVLIRWAAHSDRQTQAARGGSVRTGPPSATHPTAPCWWRTVQGDLALPALPHPASPPSNPPQGCCCCCCCCCLERGHLRCAGAWQACLQPGRKAAGVSRGPAQDPSTSQKPPIAHQTSPMS